VEDNDKQSCSCLAWLDSWENKGGGNHIPAPSWFPVKIYLLLQGMEKVPVSGSPGPAK